jgi:hypothetical protein
MSVTDYIDHYSKYLETMSQEQLEAFVHGASGGRTAGETDEAYAIRQTLVDKARAIVDANANYSRELDQVVKTKCSASPSSPACHYAQGAKAYLKRFFKTGDTGDLANSVEQLSHVFPAGQLKKALEERDPFSYP